MNIGNEFINNNSILYFKDKISLNSENSLHFKNIAKEYLRKSEYRIILDCENLEFIDSSGISALISCLKEALLNNGSVKITHISESIKYIFEIIKLDRIFEIYNSLEEAIETK